MFFPRGGSAHVAHALAHGLVEHDWDVTIVSGSHAGHGDARVFYDGLALQAVDFDAGDAPMHPSYEDRPGAPDCVFAAVDDAAYARHVDAWARALEAAGAADHDVLHLHHLTPLYEAAARVAPDVPIVGHLHGTELLMLERIAEGAPPSWKHARAWEERMQRWAGSCERILLLSPSQLERAVDLLDVDPARCVVVPNGFDPSVFERRSVDRERFWRRHLVEQPCGWAPDADEGSIAYSEEDVASLHQGPVLVAVGRFTEVKRMPLLVRAFARARARVDGPAGLVLVGGHPGEWEGEHPYEVVQDVGARDVFLAGWHPHATLPEFFAAADAVVLASVREQFGLVLVEGMACGLPAIAVDRYGPAEIVEDGRTGWLVEPDDEGALAGAIEHCLTDADERRRRAAHAWEAARERYSWPSIAGDVAAVLDEVAAVGAAA